MNPSFQEDRSPLRMPPVNAPDLPPTATLKARFDQIVGLSSVDGEKLWNALSPLLSQCAGVRSEELFGEYMLHLAQRQRAWQSEEQTYDREALSPFDEATFHANLTTQLHAIIRERGEAVPTSLGAASSLTDGRLHAHITSIAQSFILEAASDIIIRGVVGTLHSLIIAEGPSPVRYGITHFSQLATERHSDLLREGQSSMRVALDSDFFRAFIDILRHGTIQFRGTPITIDAIRVLGDSDAAVGGRLGWELRGSNCAVVLEGRNLDGSPVSLIIKKEDATAQGTHRAINSIAAAMGLRSYGMSSLLDRSGKVTQGWVVIEKIPAEPMSPELLAELFRNEHLEESDGSGADFVLWRSVRELGGILALEYACAAEDCLPRHILFDQHGRRPFRIDWEHSLQYDDNFHFDPPARSCMKGTHRDLITSIVSGDDYRYRTLLNGYELMRDNIRRDLDSTRGWIRPVLETHLGADHAEKVAAQMARRCAQGISEQYVKSMYRPLISSPDLDFDFVPQHQAS